MGEEVDRRRSEKSRGQRWCRTVPGFAELIESFMLIKRARNPNHSVSASSFTDFDTFYYVSQTSTTIKLTKAIYRFLLAILSKFCLGLDLSLYIAAPKKPHEATYHYGRPDVAPMCF